MDTGSGNLAFLPLGGTGEIGMNFNLYCCAGRWLAVDCGIGFGGVDWPEAEIILPDPFFIAERRDRLVGLVITHGHEDHLGAVAHLWPQLRCPVFATPFAAAILRRKLAEAALLAKVPLRVVPPGGAIDLPPFSLRYLPMTHSLPEAQALAIRTPHGTVLHTGDWKLDREPLIGPLTDEKELAALGEAGVLALVCDSTNAMVDGHSGSEAMVRENLTRLIASIRGRVAVTCFASNIARVESVALAASACGRRTALIGRSLRNLEAAARECGYFKKAPPFLFEEEANEVAEDEIVLLVTGSQGEPRSALARIAAGEHPVISLGRGDTVVFSSRVIPGNERAIATVQDNLLRRGVRVITEADYPIHVSGHPAREELRRLYSLIRPRYAVPVHGEWRHLSAHAALAAEAGATPMLIEDGDMLMLGPGRPEVVDSAPVGRLALDGNRLVPLSGGVLAARRQMLRNGVVFASIAVDQAGRLRGEAHLSAPGLFEDGDPAVKAATAEFAAALAELPESLRRDEMALLAAAKSVLRRVLGRSLGKRPLVNVHLFRIG